MGGSSRVQLYQLATTGVQTRPKVYILLRADLRRGEHRNSHMRILQQKLNPSRWQGKELDSLALILSLPSDFPQPALRLLFVTGPTGQPERE